MPKPKRLVKGMREKVNHDGFSEEFFDRINDGLSELRCAFERGDHDYLIEGIHTLLTVARNAKKNWEVRNRFPGSMLHGNNPLDNLPLIPIA